MLFNPVFKKCVFKKVFFKKAVTYRMCLVGYNIAVAGLLKATYQ